MTGEIMRYPFLQDLIKNIFKVSISKTIIIDEYTSDGTALYGFYLNNGNKLPIFPSFKKINIKDIQLINRHIIMTKKQLKNFVKILFYVII